MEAGIGHQVLLVSVNSIDRRFVCSQSIGSALHYMITIHQRHRQTDRRHAHSISATCVWPKC